MAELVLKLRAASNQALERATVEAMTTNESFFFRDKVPFENFTSVILPKLLGVRHARKGDPHLVRGGLDRSGTLFARYSHQGKRRQARGSCAC